MLFFDLAPKLEWMEQARLFLTQYSGTESYVLFYFILIGCGIGLPFNSDLILITASVLAALGFFKLSILMPLAFLGLLTGDTINFFVARKFGPVLLAKRPFRWLLSPEKVRKAEIFLAAKGDRFLFCIRFLPLIRTALFFTAGSLQVKPRTFYLLNVTSTVIYLVLLMNAAHSAGENAELLFAGFKRFQFILLGLVIAGGVALYLKKKRPVAP